MDPVPLTVLPIFTNHNYIYSTIKIIFFYTIYSFSQPSNSTRTWLNELRCLGTERILIDCPANTIGVEDCTHTQDVALVCAASKLDDYMNIVRCMQYSNICTVPMHVCICIGAVYVG